MKNYTDKRIDRLTKRYYESYRNGRFDDAQMIADAITRYDDDLPDPAVSQNKRRNDMKGLRADLCDFLRDFHDNGCIDDDTKFTVIYNNGTSMCYPDDVADMKKTGIAYIYKINADDECDSDCGFFVAILGPEKKDDYFKYIENKYEHKNEEFAKAYEKEKRPHYMTLDDFQSWENSKKQHTDKGGMKK